MTNTTTGLLHHMMSLNLLGLNSQLPDTSQLMFEAVVGSHGRGVATATSDLDLVGLFVPYYEELYSYKVPGFGTNQKRFKTLHASDVSVRLDHVGTVVVDVLALDIVHFFNMLLKPSPNHVEYLFFNDATMWYSTAGKYLLQNRNHFLTQELVTKCVALGCSVLSRNKENTNKDYAFATRFFAYAHQMVTNGTLNVDDVRGLHLRVLSEKPERAKKWAELTRELAREAETKVSDLPPYLDEEKTNTLLLNVLKKHWAERAVLDNVEKNYE
jgi:hypothetical protein